MIKSFADNDPTRASLEKEETFAADMGHLIGLSNSFARPSFCVVNLKKKKTN
jgi:hypothetical protein